MDTSRIATQNYWQNILLPMYEKPVNAGTKKWYPVSHEWGRSFDIFFEDVGPMPSPSAKLRKLDKALPFQKGNAEWVGGRTRRKGTRCGPSPKVDDSVVREILTLGHENGVSVKALVGFFPELTARDVIDLLSGRRYRLLDYDYNLRFRNLRTDQRVPAAVVRDIADLHAKGLGPEDIARKWGIDIRRVYAVLGRL